MYQQPFSPPTICRENDVCLSYHFLLLHNDWGRLEIEQVQYCTKSFDPNHPCIQKLILLLLLHFYQSLVIPVCGGPLSCGGPGNCPVCLPPLNPTLWREVPFSELDFTEARDSEWQWHQLGHMQVCTSLQTDNHASTPLLSFLQAGCPPVARPTASKHWRHKAH